MSKSEVSRICGELDTVVAAFRTRPLTGEHRYLWVDATYHTVRVDGRVISQATVVAVGVTELAARRFCTSPRELSSRRGRLYCPGRVGRRERTADDHPDEDHTPPAAAL